MFEDRALRPFQVLFRIDKHGDLVVARSLVGPQFGEVPQAHRVPEHARHRAIGSPSSWLQMGTERATVRSFVASLMNTIERCGAVIGATSTGRVLLGKSRPWP